jgi:hypothetical protein
LAGQAGTGGNWGFKTSRFPQAWNLAEAIRRTNSRVDVVVLDSGFVARPDVLPSLTVHDDDRPGHR